MCSGKGHEPDWRDAAAYAPLLAADRSIFAWEWLRRDQHYRNAAQHALRRSGKAVQGSGPELWGLHAFEDPRSATPDALPVWRADVEPHVLAVHAIPYAGEDAFDLERFAAISTLVTAADAREHVLISDGIRAIRIDVLSGSIKAGPVRLRYLLAGLASAERPLITLRRLLMLSRTGRFSAVLHPAETRARRLILMLRAYDGLTSGATQREIAAELLNREADEGRWRVRAPSLRSRVQRLAIEARRKASGAYLELLR